MFIVGAKMSQHTETETDFIKYVMNLKQVGGVEGSWNKWVLNYLGKEIDKLTAENERLVAENNHYRHKEANKYKFLDEDEPEDDTPEHWKLIQSID